MLFSDFTQSDPAPAGPPKPLGPLPQHGDPAIPGGQRRESQASHHTERKTAPARKSALPGVTQTAGDTGGQDWNQQARLLCALSQGLASGAAAVDGNSCDSWCLFSWSHSSKGLMFNSLQPLGLCAGSWRVSLPPSPIPEARSLPCRGGGAGEVTGGSTCLFGVFGKLRAGRQGPHCGVPQGPTTLDWAGCWGPWEDPAGCGVKYGGGPGQWPCAHLDWGGAQLACLSAGPSLCPPWTEQIPSTHASLSSAPTPPTPCGSQGCPGEPQAGSGLRSGLPPGEGSPGALSLPPPRVIGQGSFSSPGKAESLRLPVAKEVSPGSASLPPAQ